MEFFRRTKGVISVFLIIIMLPLLTSAVILVDGTRYHSAKTMVQEAGDLAAYSTIANYNIDLKDEYGLFAIDDDNLTATFKKYFTETLGYSESDAETYSKKVQNLISSTVFGGGDYKNANFFNMYNFDVVSANATPLYPLSDPGVLQNQIVEYTKYRGIETLLERFEIISNFNKLSDELNNNSEKAAAIEDLAYYDSAYSAKISEQLRLLKKEIVGDESTSSYNSLLDKVGSYLSDYENAYANEICQMATKGDSLTYWKNQRKAAITNVKNQIEAVLSRRTAIIDRCNHIQGLAEAAKENYKGLKNRYSAQTDICADIQKEIDILNVITSTKEEHRKYSVYHAKNIVSPESFFQNEIISKIDSAEANINGVYNKYNKEYKELKAELDADELLFESEKQEQLKTVRYHVTKKNGGEWFYTVEDFTEKPIDSSMKGASVNGAMYLIGEYDIKGYFDRHIKEFKCVDFENYYLTSANSTNQSKIPESVKNQKDTYASTSASNANSSKKEAEVEKVTIDAGTFSSLPSQKAGKGSSAEETVIDDISEKNAANAISSANSSSSNLTKILESGRNDILTYAYIMDMFKTRVTASGINSKDKPTGINERNLVDWRYSSEDGEEDLRYRPKSGLQTAFGSYEVEYIFAGKSSESKNGAIVYSWIYGTRLANNLIAVYTDHEAKLECEMLAAMSSAATMGAVPASVFKWIYIAAWAAGETALELSYLIDDGYKVPLIKSSENLFIEHFWDAAEAVANKDGLIRRKHTSNEFLDKINVSYEDYLLILMCFVDRETRLLRTADLIQLNMNKRHGGGFSMNESYTYLKADTTVRIKYMFEPVKQFTNSYKGTGLKFNNTIYQGY